jgi:hypothetical protein
MTRSRPLWILAVLVGVLGTFTFTTRGVLAAFDLQRSGNADWRLVYAASRAWLVGELPYDAASVRSAFDAAAGDSRQDAMNTRTSEVLVYPPPALAALSPLAALPWRIAAPLWTVLSIAMYAGAIALLAAIAGLRGPWRLLFAGLALLLCPMHTLLWQGQTAAPVLLFVALSAWLIHVTQPPAPRLGRSSHAATTHIIAGVLLGIASVLKPQLGFVFLVYHAGRFRWTVTVAGGLTIAALTTLAIARMGLAGVAWLNPYRANLAAFTATSDASPLSINPIRYHLLNLHYPLHTILGDAAPVGMLVLAIVAAASLVYLRLDWHRDADLGERHVLGHELLSLSMAAAVTLVVAYHRIYDAVLLLIPLAMLLSPTWRAMQWRTTTVLLWIIILSFLGPWPVIMTRLAERGNVPPALSASWLWNSVIVPGHAWALTVLMIVLVVIRRKLTVPASALPRP